MKPLFYLNKFFLKYKLRLFLGVIFVAANNYFGAEAKLYVGKAADFVKDVLNKGGEFSQSVNHKLIMFGVLLIALVLLQAIFMFFMRQMIIVMSRLIEYESKNEIYDHYQKLDQGFYKMNNTGDLMNRISEDVGRVRMYTGPAMMYMANTAGSFFFTIPYMMQMNTGLTLIALAPMPVIVLACWYVSTLINKRSIAVQTQLSSISTFTQETFSGIRVMKAFVREKQMNEAFGNETQKYRSLYLRLVKTDGAFQPLILFLMGLSNILAIYFGGMACVKGTMTPGQIISFIMYINGLIWPIASLGWVTSLVQRAAASQERINEFLHTEPSVNNQTGTENFSVIRGDIEFRNVDLNYSDSGVKALKNISFSIASGKSLAIVGRTGSGKSTIAGLLTRLYDPSSGEVLVDGKNLKKWKLDYLRRNIGYVPQEVFLFSDTIRNNILFGNQSDDTSQEAIEKAAKWAAIHDGIMEFPKGYDTLLGERGITLSGGQKQRISMARALIEQHPILIFDDCLSAVDIETEEEILGNLKEISKNTTSIIISHRISSVKQCDHILVLEKGRIIEEGDHDNLLQKKGAYKAMYEQQLLEKEFKIL